jgi:hypothetical protein
MKPVTQMLRAYTEPTASYEKKPGKKKSEFEKQLDDIEEVRRALGPQAWPWFGPTLIFDVETHTRVGQPLRFGVAQIRGKTYRHLMELGKKYKRNVPREVMDEQWARDILFYLKRQRLVILDQEYIGKETNSLIDEDILEAQGWTTMTCRWSGSPVTRLMSISSNHSEPHR